MQSCEKLQVQNESWVLRPVAQLTYSTAPYTLWTNSSYFDENLWNEMQLKKFDSKLKWTWKAWSGCCKLAGNSLRPANFTWPYFHEEYRHMKGCTHTWSSVWTVLACESCSGKPTAQEPCCQSLRLWQSAQGQQRICSQRLLVGCKGEQTLDFLQETSKWDQSPGQYPKQSA